MEASSNSSNVIEISKNNNIIEISKPKGNTKQSGAKSEGRNSIGKHIRKILVFLKDTDIEKHKNALGE